MFNGISLFGTTCLAGGFHIPIKFPRMMINQTGVGIKYIFANLWCGLLPIMSSFQKAAENPSYNLFTDFSANGICGAVDGFFNGTLLFSAGR